MKDIIQKINAYPKIEITAKCFLLFILLYSTKLNALYLIAIIFFLLFSFFVRQDFYKDARTWFLIACLFIPNFISQYYLVANHYFVMFYMLIIFIIGSYYVSESHQILKTNAKWILALMMILAVIQKLLTEQFIQGNSIGFLMYFGELFKLPFRFLTESQDAIVGNAKFLNPNTAELSEVKNLQPTIPFFKTFSKYFAYSTIIVEIIFAGLLFVKNNLVKNWFFIGFVSLLILTREENGFIALLCILLMMQLEDKDNSVFRTVYLSLFLLSISLIITRWGYL